MNWTDIVPLINSEKWKQAQKEIDRLKETMPLDDMAAIVEASVYIHENDEERAYECITTGLRYNCRNYELYVMLANYYYTRNIAQSYLCYENAKFYCNSTEDKKSIGQCMREILQHSDVALPPPISIVLVSYNCREMMQNCIQSIRKTTPTSAYELIVVDNASIDGIAEWLEQQNDIVLIRNKQNRGFGYGCNQGAKAAKPDNDIFFLNNDTLIPPNAVFWLRMGLYEYQNVGATGSTSNFVGNGQHLEQSFDSIQKYMEYGEKNNIPNKNPYERKIWLSGFALLIKRCALDEIGLFDLRYGKGFFEDDDIGIRLRYAGYHLLLCKNSFIFHYGSQSFGKNANPAIQINRKIFQEKWGFDMERYTYPQTTILDFIEEEKNASIKVLEVGCGAGMVLSRIKYLWPNSVIRGIELEEKVAQLGRDYLGVEWGNAETMDFPYETDFFDYIIFSNVLETFYSPEKVIERLKPYLKRNGRMLFSIFNVAHVSIFASLLQGAFAYSATNILNKDHIRFFAINDITQIMDQCSLVIEEFQGIKDENPMIVYPKDFIETLRQTAEKNADLLQVSQYIVKVKKK